jgi:hypothetical protein
MVEPADWGPAGGEEGASEDRGGGTREGVAMVGRSSAAQQWRSWPRRAGREQQRRGRVKRGERGRALSKSGGVGLVQKREGAAGMRSIMVGALLMHGHHAVIPSSMWWAATWPRWGADLGQIRAKLDNEPKTKFAAHMKTYKFYLRCTSIRAMD